MMVQSHSVEWLWWDTGASGTFEAESPEQAFEKIAELHIEAGESGRELSTFYTRKQHREAPDEFIRIAVDSA